MGDCGLTWEVLSHLAIFLILGAQAILLFLQRMDNIRFHTDAMRERQFYENSQNLIVEKLSRLIAGLENGKHE